MELFTTPAERDAAAPDVKSLYAKIGQLAMGRPRRRQLSAPTLVPVRPHEEAWSFPLTRLVAAGYASPAFDSPLPLLL